MRGQGQVRAAVAAGLVGFSCMAAELTAVRLQAPWFGDSAYVWTNVIGVILASLAGGAALGGVLAAREPAERWLLRLGLGAGFLLALAPFLARPLGEWLLPQELPLDAAMGAVIRGSLVATALLFAPPMVLLGAVGPLLVTALVRGGVRVGRAAGTVSAVGTLGSLAGTFAATHWLVPTLGCRVTMLLAAGSLLLSGALFLGRTRGAGAAGAILLSVGAPFLPLGSLRPPRPGMELLAERESPYQLLQVVRDPGPPARTMLQINEGLDSYHSLAIEGSRLTGGAYYDWHAIAPLLAGDGARPDPLRALSIGDAAGSLRSVYRAVHPGARVDGVDLDPACMELGDEFFRGDKAPGDRIAGDGRVFVSRARARWNVIHVDAYAHQVYIPAHLASVEFFREVRARLAPGGILACNVGALRPDDPVLEAIGATVVEVFGEAKAIRVPNTRNFLLLARKEARLQPERLADFRFGDERLEGADREAWRRIVGLAGDPARWHEVGRSGRVLVDDRPELDELLMAGYVAAPGGREARTGSGDVPVATAELRAYQARTHGDWLAVLEATESGDAPSAYLSELAGDARWSLRQLEVAAAEYEHALAAAEDETGRRRIRGKLEGVRADLLPQQRAEGITSRNGWLALATVALGLLFGGFLWVLGRRAIDD